MLRLREENMSGNEQTEYEENISKEESVLEIRVAE